MGSTLELRQIKDIVESLLLVSSEPVAVGDLHELLEIDDNGELLDEAVSQLEEEYRLRSRGFLIQRVDGGIRFVTKLDNASWIRKFNAGKPVRFSRAALETLAIIAYRQPITRPEIEAIRGVDASGVIRLLLVKELIAIRGKKDVPGSPLLYVTTDKFLQIFNLASLSSLPDINSFGDLYPHEELPLLDGQ
ncbi:MAG: SMC-Scp complex subunit ScpB [Deltaproteobacteria bacterium]|nr:SMC-Scp complex subunit ScpB [Candidatus Anaeroferrophillus wilburensis]MBN2888299.1 SMC-Scp complex subunit ScpB [Deltaproteobacteria bacterium]